MDIPSSIPLSNYFEIIYYMSQVKNNNKTEETTRSYGVFYEKDHRGAYITLHEFIRDDDGNKSYMESPPYTWSFETGEIWFNESNERSERSERNENSERNESSERSERNERSEHDCFLIYFYTGVSYKPILLDMTSTLFAAKEFCKRLFVHLVGTSAPTITGLPEEISRKIPSKDSYPERRVTQEPSFACVTNRKYDILYILPIEPCLAFTIVIPNVTDENI